MGRISVRQTELQLCKQTPLPTPPHQRRMVQSCVCVCMCVCVCVCEFVALPCQAFGRVQPRRNANSQS